MSRTAGSGKSGHGTGLVMIVCGSLVALVVGISGNVVADSLPPWLSRWALPAFLAGSLLSVVIGVVVFRMDRRRDTPAGELTGRDRLRLLDGVAGQAADLLWFPPDDPPPLRLGLAPRADLVSSPRHHFAQRLPPEADVVTAYEQAERVLLVAGGPGSGKSRQLAELTAHLVVLAREDPQAPVPVLVSLATWTPERGRMAAWLVRELKDRYDVPVAIGAAAVAGGQVQPMLDGLDESADVAACVAAVNAFRDEHGLVPLVVCSRLVEYERCGARLRLRGAVELRPPSPEDVRRYLGAAGVPAATVEALEEDMAELLTAPLTLSLIGRTCRGDTEIQLADSTDRAQRWAPVFDAYVDRMLHRARDPGREPGRQRPPSYDEADVRRWLGWLAGATLDRFRLDRLQPDVLPADGQLAWDRLSGWLPALWPASALGFSVGSVAYWGTGRLGLPGPVWWAVAVGLLVLVAVEVVTGGVPSAWKPIEPVEVLRWKRGERLVSFAALVSVVLPLAIVTGGVSAVSAWTGDRPVWPSVFSATTVATFAALAAVFVVMALVDQVETGLAPAVQTPNEGIHRSLRYALATAGVAVVSSTALMLLLAAVSSVEFDWTPVVSLAGGLGLVLGLRFGGIAAAKHYTLRLLLVRYGCAPLRYVRFLDFCAERVLLRRVGGAYEFLHPMMRDHLAAGWPAAPTPVEERATP